MPEPSLRSQALDRLAQERRRDIECPHGHSCRPQVTGGVRVAVNFCRGLPEALDYCWCLPERVGIGLDRKDPQVCRFRVAQAIGRLDKNPACHRCRIHHPGPRSDKPGHVELQIAIACLARMLGGSDQ